MKKAAYWELKKLRNRMTRKVESASTNSRSWGGIVAGKGGATTNFRIPEKSPNEILKEATAE